MRKRTKGVCTLLLAGALVASLIPGLPGARAAVAVDTSEECSLEIGVGVQFDELTSQEVLVDLYRVADVDSTGKYTSVGEFSGMSFGYIEDSEGAADEWNELASEAAKIAAGNAGDTHGSGSVEDTDHSESAEAVSPDVTVTIPEGSGSATEEGLPTGLYLVVPREVTTDYYTYSFTPSLVSIPNNYYYKTGDDTWVYDLTGSNAVELKPSQEERLGSLDIVKTLTDWSATAGAKTTFIFEISYTTPKGATKTMQEVMSFTGAGEQTLTIADIPAGSTITVEEVYSGAVYEVVADSDGGDLGTVSLAAIADEAVTAAFTNSHDDTPGGGYGVVNHFEEDASGQYQMTQQDATDGRAAAE